MDLGVSAHPVDVVARKTHQRADLPEPLLERQRVGEDLVAERIVGQHR
jgi:hypothetical protein